MPTGPQGQVRPSDTIENAIVVARLATGEIEEACPSDEEDVNPEEPKSSP